MKKILVALLFLTACKPTRLMDVNTCGQSCWTGSSQTNGIGQCSAGTWDCTTDGGATCRGMVGPSTETCDGIDNDCDGKIDNHIPNDPKLCRNQCGTGVQQCVNGDWTKCSAPDPKPETCNGKDDDCDGTVDNNLPIEFCYDGPTGSAGIGVCHPGVKSCVNSTLVCSGQVTPKSESCNDLDDNCDGAVDNTTFACSTPRDLKVILTWNDPSDIDLHLRSPIAYGSSHLSNGWGLAQHVIPYDCFYSNKDPIWYPTDPNRDPHLDHDDTTATGPEKITIAKMDLNDVYTIGVHMYGWHQTTPVTATVTVFCGGLQISTSQQALTFQKEMWVVGTVQYSATTGCQFIADGLTF